MDTKNLTLFNLVRQKIRDYNEISGVSFDTYERSAFVAQLGITMYIPSQYKMMPIKLIVGIIQKNYPQLNHPYKIIEKSTFTSEGPGFKGGRSRIGDQIILLEGSRPFMEGLAKFPESFLFDVSRSWKVTLRGGKRADSQGSKDADDMSNFSEQFRTSVLVDSAGTAMEEAKRSFSRPL